MHVILTIFVAAVVIFLLWFLIVLRTGLGTIDESDHDKKPGDRPRS